MPHCRILAVPSQNACCERYVRPSMGCKVGEQTNRSEVALFIYHLPLIRLTRLVRIIVCLVSFDHRCNHWINLIHLKHS